MRRPAAKEAESQGKVWPVERSSRSSQATLGSGSCNWIAPSIESLSKPPPSRTKVGIAGWFPTTMRMLEAGRERRSSTKLLKEMQSQGWRRLLPTIRIDAVRCKTPVENCPDPAATDTLPSVACTARSTSSGDLSPVPGGRSPDAPSAHQRTSSQGERREETPPAHAGKRKSPDVESGRRLDDFQGPSCEWVRFHRSNVRRPWGVWFPSLDAPSIDGPNQTSAAIRSHSGYRDAGHARSVG